MNNFQAILILISITIHTIIILAKIDYKIGKLDKRWRETLEGKTKKP